MNKNIIKNILKQGGATLNKQGKKAHFKNGYQVSKKDCYILDITQLDKITQAISTLLTSIKQNEYVGIWVDSNKVYIDISIKHANILNALKVGARLNQISIFDWSSKECIYLN